MSSRFLTVTPTTPMSTPTSHSTQHNDITDSLTSRGFYVGDYGIAGGGVTDETVALQALIDLVGVAGGGTIVFGPFDYLCHTVVSAGGLTWALSVSGDNIHFRGVPGKSRIFTDQNAALFHIDGANKPAGAANWASYHLPSMVDGGTGLKALSGSTARGDVSIVAASSPDATALVTGDLLYIRTGQTGSNTATGEPDSELNEVLSTPTDATIRLKYPLSKPYAQEWYVSGTSGRTSTVNTGQTAPYGFAKVSDRILRNITFEDLIIDNRLSTGRSLWNHYQIDGLRVRNCDLRTSLHASNQICVRDQWVQSNRIRLTGTADTSWGWAPSTGCTQGVIEDNTIHCEQKVTQMHIHEGMADFTYARNKVFSAPTPGNITHVFDIRGRAYNVKILDNTIVNGGDGTAIYVDEECAGGGQIRGNTVRGGPFVDAIGVGCSGWDVDPGDIGTLGFSVYNNAASGVSADGFAPTNMRAVFGWVADSNQTQVLGLVPLYSFITAIWVYVKEAFNSDGTDTLTVGYGGSESAFATSVDVSTTGRKTVTLGSGAVFLGANRVATAYYSNGGTEPTTGKALVVVEFARVQREIA